MIRAQYVKENVRSIKSILEHTLLHTFNHGSHPSLSWLFLTRWMMKTLSFVLRSTTLVSVSKPQQDHIFLNDLLIAPIPISGKLVFIRRGVLIDSSRNFLKVEDIKRILDAMSYNKLNVLHWHIVDQHSFPLKTSTYPELADKGAYSKNWVYTEIDIRGLVCYAKDRGIFVVRYGYSAAPISGQLNIINPKTDEIVRNLLKEVTQWFEDDFVNNKIPITWPETLTGHLVPIGKDVAVQVWLSVADALKVVRAGYRMIATSYEKWYFDCGHGAWISDSQGNSWCNPFKSWQVAYHYDLTANMTKEGAKFVLGGEVALWSEQIDSTNLDRTLWPRGAAAAEVTWSDIKLADGTIRKTEDVFPRIHEQRARLIDRNIRVDPMQPLWCARNPRNG
ncbi:Glucosamine-6-phosphate isomerase (Glucosamine-6-phosphate deaminase) (GNPDA) (GlcN6P deaminase) [Basidiobolus ranarum]|uniref:beta-N-acetylhexosaminidase n=1 Tax=Basidiobolus ranarum TaxID=34480 RepID=A0ABR2WIU6_9FUNG